MFGSPPVAAGLANIVSLHYSKNSARIITSPIFRNLPLEVVGSNVGLVTSINIGLI